MDDALYEVVAPGAVRAEDACRMEGRLTDHSLYAVPPKQRILKANLEGIAAALEGRARDIHFQVTDIAVSQSHIEKRAEISGVTVQKPRITSSVNLQESSRPQGQEYALSLAILEFPIPTAGQFLSNFIFCSAAACF